jgi:Cd2+/Zn2+-exporting ATPase
MTTVSAFYEPHDKLHKLIFLNLECFDAKAAFVAIKNMQKTRINLDIILPEIPDERDQCVNRIIDSLQNKKGIEKVHVVPQNGHHKAQLCFHYNPQIISIIKVEELARKAGAAITDHYGHLLVEIGGVQHPRHARLIETKLKSKRGIQNVSVGGTGYIRLEYDS